MLLHMSLAVLAGIVQIATVYALRVGFLKSFLWAIPFVLLHQYLFIFNYTKAPNFIIIWFVTAGITSALSILIGYYFFKDILTIYQIVGVVLILIGMAFLRF